jgi:enediyne polyketide synthase
MTADEQVQVEWLESGKPVLEGGDGVDTSLAHDDGACLCVAGNWPQGCDLAPVTARTRESWLGLLGAEREHQVDALVAAGDSLDQAGTRIWAVVEAVRKASGAAPDELSVQDRKGDSVLFRSSALHVLTFPLRLARGPERIVAVTVEPEPQAEAATEPPGSAAAKYGFDPDAYALEVTEDGPIEGRPVVTVRFPLTFRETGNLSRTLYFSHVFAWMGKLRELACQPVYGPLAQQFATGRWGMVTNYGETRIFGEARAEDTIEGRFWLGPASGRFGSTQEFHYDWRRVLSDGTRERFAWSRMGVTWVEILGHGVVEARPLPDYYAEFMERATPACSPEARAQLEPLPSADEIDLGELIWESPPGPVNRTFLHEETFDTSLEESNLVGNIYFANYYVWQGPTRDRFFRSLAPDLYVGAGEHGELRCLYVRIEHLREAMPFQRIAARMSLESLHERGFRLRFDYFRLEGDKREKLGSGVHAAGWSAPSAQGTWEPAPLPAILRDQLLERARRAPS